MVQLASSDPAVAFVPATVTVAPGSAVSPFFPIATLLPMREYVGARLWWPTFLGRAITLEGRLDPDAYWPFVDTIGGSRWPGTMGGPKRG